MPVEETEDQAEELSVNRSPLIGFAKYDTEKQAEQSRIRLQAHHDGTASIDNPRIVDCIVKLDGKFALTLLPGDESFDIEDGVLE